VGLKAQAGGGGRQKTQTSAREESLQIDKSDTGRRRPLLRTVNSGKGRERHRTGTASTWESMEGGTIETCGEKREEGRGPHIAVEWRGVKTGRSGRRLLAKEEEQ